MRGLLNATTSETQALSDTARELAAQLRGTDQWTAFRAAHESLTAPERDQLRQARVHLTRTLVGNPSSPPETIANHDARLADWEHDEIARLPRQAQRYAEAFARVDAVTNLACTHVFGDRVLYKPLLIRATGGIEFTGTILRIETAPTARAEWPEVGRTAWIDNPLMRRRPH